MTSLTEQEVAVLMITATGESLAAIAAWEKPIENLVKKGWLHQHDKFNNTITEAGRAALAAYERDEDEDLKQAMTEIVPRQEALLYAQNDLAARAGEIAKQLADLAKDSANQTGKTPLYDLKEWASVILADAKERL